MSSDRVPPRAEVMGWSPLQLADYLKRMSLSGCDKAVLKYSISGARFVNMSDNDLHKFPKLHAPMISKISTEIRKKEERRGLFSKKASTLPKYQEPETAAEVQGWGDDEFDDEFDNDYESPYSGDENDSGGDYESPNEECDAADDYEPPPTEPPEDLVHKLGPSLPIGDGDYIDSHVSSRGPPPAVCPRPLPPTLSVPSSQMPTESSSFRRDHSPRGDRLMPPGPPQIFRDNKPGRDAGSNPSPRGPHRGTHEKPSTKPWRPQADVPEIHSWSKPAIPPSTTSVGRSNSSCQSFANKFDGRREQPHDHSAPSHPASKHHTFPLHNKNPPMRPVHAALPPRHGDSLPPNMPSAESLPQRLQSAMADHRSSIRSDKPLFCPPQPTKQDLDPRWYVGKVSRGQAEGCLKRVNKDGAYLVRDSTRQLDNQPFTLMVFYQDKVYNIQIRQQNQQFLLGTGLKVQETFPSVSDIINHYSQSALLLIDAKNRSSSQQNQTLLSDPAGYYMTRHN